MSEKLEQRAVDEGLGDYEHTKQQNITRVEEVDLSAYHFTDEENRAVVRKFDWHVRGSPPCPPASAYDADRSFRSSGVRSWLSPSAHLTKSRVLLVQLAGSKQCLQRQIRQYDRYGYAFLALSWFQSLKPTQVDLHFPTNGYALMLTAFYVADSVLVVPGVMLTRKIGPRWTIPGYMIGWGSMAMINAGCNNFGGAVTVRFCEGCSKPTGERVRS